MNILDTIEKESEAYEAISKAIETLKSACRIRIELGMKYDDLVKAITELSEARLPLSISHSVMIDN